MPSSYAPQISIAAQADIPAIRRLLNSAYRGESSKGGWTTEAHLISGEQRTTDAELQRTMQLPRGIFLKYTDDENRLSGCVNLQQHGDKLYLGMFSVSPLLQGGGIGKMLLAAAETHAKECGCKTIYMTVISVRDELISWYKRHGYHDTGKRVAFEEDGIHGAHLQPLEFMELEKKME